MVKSIVELFGSLKRNVRVKPVPIPSKLLLED